MSTTNTKPPVLLKWRSHTIFIVATVAIGLFTDLFLYGLVVPVFPYMLRNRVNTPEDKIQSYVSGMLAAYAGSSVIFSFPAGWVADQTNARRTPFLAGLAALLAATIMLSFGQSIAVLVASRILQGLSAAIVWVVGLAMILDTVGPENLGKTFGTIFSFISVGELAAPVLGGVLYDKTGYTGVFGVGAALLGIDIIMRIIVIEKKVAKRYSESAQNDASHPRHHNTRGDDAENEDDSSEGANEESSLLGPKGEKSYRIPEGQPKVVRSLPILYCLKDSRLITALLVALMQASLLGAFDATIPTEAKDLFGFSSLSSGLLFIALDIPYVLLGPVAGWAVDKYGTKPISVIGFGCLVPTLILLRLPTEKLGLDRTNNIVLYCAMLALNGTFMAIIGSPSIVEASDVCTRYDKANPEFFGENGPYAQLYAFNSMLFCTGLTVGPVVSGALRDYIGYGNMNLVLAVISGFIAILSFVYMGGKPKMLTRKK